MQAIDHVIKARLESLSAQTLPDLAGLPDHASEEIQVEGSRVILTVWHDEMQPGVHRIVVQAYRPWILGGQMSAEGFIVNDRDERRPLTTAEWAPFA